MASTRSIEVTVNGVTHRRDVEPRTTLVDFLRNDLGLTGTHVGCEHGVCGACTLLVDGRAVRSCIMLAVQADGRSLTTVEGLAGEQGLHPVQQAFLEEHGLQCGFCTPGFLLSVVELLGDHPDPTEEQIVDMIGGQICRCTGYQAILRSVHLAVEKVREANAAAVAAGQGGA